MPGHYFSQHGFDVRLEWGLAAAQHLAQDADCVIVVDVMSFSTCVSVANDNGALIAPWPWKDASAQAYAAEMGAQAASIDRRFSAETFTLSPASLLNIPAGTKLVLPSPNGSTIAFKARDHGGAVFSAGLRNRQATAAACGHFQRILVIPCGERWPDGSLRPAIEDYVAAGGIIQALGTRLRSPEAEMAAAAFQAAQQQNFAVLKECASATELRGRGFATDVELCLQVDVSANACQLAGKFFVPCVNDNSN
ncbi:2-phosphosulfolactate phosphatase [Pantoea sp.]|uniref:2-phosphosulfolactate phosphatase n=1 Tax=Pantoea sp. TaxID=69393 RepID=UPI0028AF0442|nr:2-phosphosulfolactate phosphatase [Pantoea sp.]